MQNFPFVFLINFFTSFHSFRSWIRLVFVSNWLQGGQKKAPTPFFFSFVLLFTRWRPFLTFCCFALTDGLMDIFFLIFPPSRHVTMLALLISILFLFFACNCTNPFRGIFLFYYPLPSSSLQSASSSLFFFYVLSICFFFLLVLVRHHFPYFFLPFFTFF